MSGSLLEKLPETGLELACGRTMNFVAKRGIYEKFIEHIIFIRVPEENNDIWQSLRENIYVGVINNFIGVIEGSNLRDRLPSVPVGGAVFPPLCAAWNGLRWIIEEPALRREKVSIQRGRQSLLIKAKGSLSDDPNGYVIGRVQDPR